MSDEAAANETLERASLAGTYPMKQGRFLDPNSLVFTAIVKIGERATRNKALKLKVSYGSKGQIEDTIILPVSTSHNSSGLATTNGVGHEAFIDVFDAPARDSRFRTFLHFEAISSFRIILEILLSVHSGSFFRNIRRGLFHRARSNWRLPKPP